MSATVKAVRQLTSDEQQMLAGCVHVCIDITNHGDPMGLKALRFGIPNAKQQLQKMKELLENSPFMVIELEGEGSLASFVQMKFKHIGGE